ncbi:hypothetical protein [Vulcanisaeta distributa]|uniref:hypothetical protein n=1 Tax=Vulcanisaeta distributa TaxID=164451 RepID=UPI001FB47158|nr:hypothetical protein [Vulcanisaeta distributa]
MSLRFTAIRSIRVIGLRGPYGYVAVRKESAIRRFNSINKRRLLMLIARELVKIRQSTTQARST